MSGKTGCRGMIRVNKKISVAVLCLFVCTTAIFAKPKKGERMFVNVQQASLRVKKSSLSKETEKLSFGDPVIIESADKEWFYVTSQISGSKGWISANSVTKHRPSESSGYSTLTGELALAGKGFTEEVENLYKENGVIDYSLVDSIENTSVTTNQVTTFIIEGNLSTGEQK